MTDTHEDTVTRPFADWLREQQQGRTHDELSEALRDLVAAVTTHGKKGSLTFTVTVAPIKDSNTDVLSVTDDVKVNLPKPERKGSVFYPDAHSNLTRTDPNQLQFESLRDVSANPTDPSDLKEAK